MDNLIFSINAVFPLFIIIFVGLLIKKINLIDDKGVKTLNTIVFNIALPTQLFYTIANSNVKDDFDLSFIIYSVSASIIFFLIIWGGSELLIKDKTRIGAFVQGCFRGNYSIIGLVLIGEIMGDDFTLGVLVTALIIPLYNILSIIVLSMRSCHQERVSFKKTLIGIFKNPLTIGIFLGLPFSLLDFRFFNETNFKFIGSTLISIGNLTTPAAVLAIGASISFAKLKASFLLSIVASFIKLIICPLMIVVVAYILKFDGGALLVLFIMSGAPSAVSGFIMASKMGSDENLAANVVLISTLFSIVTITAGTVIFKSLELI